MIFNTNKTVDIGFYFNDSQKFKRKNNNQLYIPINVQGEILSCTVFNCVY